MCNPLIFSLSGKQDYKKTKLDLKLTRLKAEAKKNSSGFKVRIAGLTILFRTGDFCISIFFSFCWPVYSILWFWFSGCLPTFFFSHVCPSTCLRVSLTRSFPYLLLFALIQPSSGFLMNITIYCISACNDVMWPPCLFLKVWPIRKKPSLKNTWAFLRIQLTKLSSVYKKMTLHMSSLKIKNKVHR